MTTPADQVNAPDTVFNEPTQLYNGPGAPPITPRRYLTRLVDREPVGGHVVPSGTPVVLTDFVAAPSDTVSNERVVTDVLDTVQRAPISGAFSAVRAVRVLHQYRIAFWSDAGVIDHVASSQAADPTQDQIDNSYNQFQVFSYLPNSMMPSAQEFGDLITPSKNVTNTRNALSLMGINTTVVTNPVPEFAAEPDLPVLPDPVPFASNLSQFCAVLP